MRFLGVVTGTLAALLLLLAFWGGGILLPPERLTRGIAALYAVFPGPVTEAEVARIPCAPLRRLRLYVVCTEGCGGVWRIVGVRGLRAVSLVNLGRSPAEPDDVVRRRLDEALAEEGLRLEIAGAREMIGCYLEIAGLRPDLILTDTDFQTLENARGDEVALEALAMSLEDPEALARILLREDGDGFNARFLYWNTARPGRPVLEVEIRIATDGRLRAVLAREVPVTPGPAHGTPQDAFPF
ncbi:MAG: hypothetical protein HY510_01770 [Acidobacteria bacterium]|nr:hypothetical protein [Acidobacteriota bacterium]